VHTNLKSLIGTLNDTCRGALEAAAGLCLTRTNYDVEVEHVLLKLVEVSRSDIVCILRYCEVNVARLSTDLTGALDRLKTGNARTPALSPRLPRWFEAAWLLASIDYGVSKVRSGHLLLALLTHDDLARLARDISPTLTALSVESLQQQFAELTASSVEEAISTSSIASGPEIRPGSGSRMPALDQYTIDLTAKARLGDIDPVLERDAEIRQGVDILMRRRQNNPILTGEAGVGKTAVVEGFALRVAQGDVPLPLKQVAVRTLDLGLLQAGAGIKGEFENRLKAVIDEVKAAPQPVIVFIDEAHTLIGAGGQAGQSDAANLLKPALTRGELRTIAATTWAEYKKYFEKDAALARRFQVVKVEEPSEEQAMVMLRGLTATLERHHHVRILDEAITGAVQLSHRYMTGRQLPDKAVSVLDTACARVALSLEATPAPLEDAQRRIAQLTVEIGALTRETATGADHTTRLAELQAARAEEEARLACLQAQWDRERELIGRINALRAQLEVPEQDDAPGGEAKRIELARLNQELEAVHGETPLLHACVTAQIIAAVLSGWTGIPVGKMLTDQIHTVLGLEDRLTQRVIGQPHALATIAQRIRTARANLTDPRRPVGVFLLVGPSGVGKTETALALADTLYGGERNLITINMSEYQEAHTVSSLKGSPPGYVGYGEGGVLTEAVRRKPYSVVLLDEVEKAHPDVMELFYQVFDKGMLEDGEGREIDFKNTIILLTSNAGSATVTELCIDAATRPAPAVLTEALRSQLLHAFKPALLGRMITVPYYPLTDAVMRDIIALQLSRIGQRLAAHHDAAFHYDEAVVCAIADRCQEVESGARNVDHILTGTLLPEMSTAFLARMAKGEAITTVHVSVAETGDFVYHIA
jgi:type VI secretion system protein VasG